MKYVCISYLPCRLHLIPEHCQRLFWSSPPSQVDLFTVVVLWRCCVYALHITPLCCAQVTNYGLRSVLMLNSVLLIAQQCRSVVLHIYVQSLFDLKLTFGRAFFFRSSVSDQSRAVFVGSRDGVLQSTARSCHVIFQPCRACRPVPLSGRNAPHSRAFSCRSRAGAWHWWRAERSFRAAVGCDCLSSSSSSLCGPGEEPAVRPGSR